MAAPSTMTTQNLTGKFFMNKTLSDPAEKILLLQGAGWLTRKAISIGNLTLHIKHTKEEGVERILIEQSLTGGIPGTTETRILNWTPRPHQDHIFGHVIGKSRRVKLDEIESPFLKKNWMEDCIEHGVVESVVDSDTPKSGKTWNVDQIWGFEAINGERRYVRHVKFTGPKKEDIEVRLVYDYLGPL